MKDSNNKTYSIAGTFYEIRNPESLSKWDRIIGHGVRIRIAKTVRIFNKEKSGWFYKHYDEESQVQYVEMFKAKNSLCWRYRHSLSEVNYHSTLAIFLRNEFEKWELRQKLDRAQGF